MMITAHGGAMGTGKNSYKYFAMMRDLKIDAIEVDVAGTKDFLYISHFPSLFPKKKIRLTYVFDYIKRYDFKVNLDVKQGGLLSRIYALAKECGVEDRIYFTGFCDLKEMYQTEGGDFYYNYPIFSKIPLKAKNVPLIVEYLRALGNPKIKGINIGYRWVDEDFLNAARDGGLPLSLYVVDDESYLAFLMKAHPELANITTNIPLVALANKENGK